jgi:hypothetical protein
MSADALCDRDVLMAALFIVAMIGAAIGAAGMWLHRWANPVDYARKFGLLASACALLDAAVIEDDATRRTALALRARSLIERANA